MIDDEGMKDFLIMVVDRLADVGAAQETLLKSQARLLAALEKRPYDEVFAELQAQVRSRRIERQEQIAAELTRRTRQRRTEGQS
jgi:hypothetical protein